MTPVSQYRGQNNNEVALLFGHNKQSEIKNKNKSKQKKKRNKKTHQTVAIFNKENAKKTIY